MQISKVFGEIDFSECLEEKSLQGFRTTPIGACKVKINNGDEGQIPHFHIDSTNNLFKTCVCIYSAHYFNHNSQSSGVFSSSQRKELDKWLRGICKDTSARPGESNWEFIARFWEENPGKNSRYPSNQKVSDQPDYTQMQMFRSR